MQAFIPGKYAVTVIEAKLTRDTDTFGKMDPFAVLNYMGIPVGTTSVLDGGGKTPKWN